MIHIFFPFQRLPNWLVRIIPENAESKVGKCYFGGLTLVQKKDDVYHIRPIIDFVGYVIVVEGCERCIIKFAPGGGMCLTYAKPMLFSLHFSNEDE